MYKLKAIYLKLKNYVNSFFKLHAVKSQKCMDIDDIWNNFSKNIGYVVLSQRDTREIYKKQLINLISIKNIYKDNEIISKMAVSVHNMSFIDPQTNSRVFYNFESISIDEKLQQIVIRKNREYQFLLMEAYEIFEDTIEEIYAYLGMKDFNFWPLNERKEYTNEDLKHKDFDFFRDKASKRKGGAIKIATYMMDYFKCNTILDNLSLKERIIFIEKLRHIIVHKRGSITNLEEFIKRVAKDSGNFNNGKINQYLIDYIEFHVSPKEYGQLIVLDEFTIPNTFPIDIKHNRFETLVNYLVICVYLIIKNIK